MRLRLDSLRARAFLLVALALLPGVGGTLHLALESGDAACPGPSEAGLRPACPPGCGDEGHHHAAHDEASCLACRAGQLASLPALARRVAEPRACELALPVARVRRAVAAATSAHPVRGPPARSVA